MLPGPHDIQRDAEAGLQLRIQAPKNLIHLMELIRVARGIRLFARKGPDLIDQAKQAAVVQVIVQTGNLLFVRLRLRHGLPRKLLPASFFSLSKGYHRA